MAELTRFDDLFFTIVRETGGLEGLLNSLFSFLGRRTDFFYEAEPGDKMGFPPGYAPRMLFSIMDKYQQEHYKKYPKKDPKEYEAKVKAYQEKLQKEKALKQETQTKQVDNSQPKFISTDSFQTVEVKKQENTIQQEEKKTQDIKIEANSSEKTEEKSKTTKASPISTYNGASTSKYNWSQGTNEVTVQIPLPEGTRAKNLNVEFTSTQLKTGIKGSNQVLLAGEFSEKIKPEDSTWTVDGSSLVLVLEKMAETIWKSVLKGDDEIDTTKVENSKPLDQFDSETQAALRKIMYEQQRKLQGLPSTDEEQQLELLKNAWNAEGSPFKGQPFDPSKFNLPGSGNFDPNI